MSDSLGLLDTDMLFYVRDPDPQVRTFAVDFVRRLRLVGTSSFAKLEFKRNWIADLAYLHALLRKSRSLAAVLLHISRNLPLHHSRKLTRVLDHIARFKAMVEASDDVAGEVERMLGYIENAVECEWERLDLYDFVADGTGCVRAREAPRTTPGGALDVTVPRCRRDRIHCTIHRHFEKHREAFGRLRERLRNLGDEGMTPQLRAFLPVLDKADQEPEYLCDDKVCRKIGDALIASDCLEGTPPPSLVSSNRSEYEVVCAALGVNYVYFPRRTGSPVSEEEAE